MLLALFGAAFLWGPVLSLVAAMRREVSLPVGTILPATTFMLGYILIGRRGMHGPEGSALTWMFWGAILLGGPILLLGTIPLGGEISWMMILLSLIPFWFTLMLSTGLGILPGVLLTIVLTVGIHEGFLGKNGFDQGEGTRSTAVIGSLWVIVIGALLYWGPLAVVALATQREPSTQLKIVLPSFSFLFGYYLGRHQLQKWAASASILMLFGIYVLGSWFVYLVTAPLPERFSEKHGWDAINILILTPLTTNVSPGHGTLLGLLLVTVLALIIHHSFERTRNQRPGQILASKPSGL